MSDFFVRKKVLETKARKILCDYDTDLLFGEPKAIPIEDIIESYLNINLQYHAIRKDHKILGCTMFSDGILPVWFEEEKKYDLIFVEKNTFVIDDILLEPDKIGRYHFTLGHELGHWKLHRKIYSDTNVALPKTPKELENNKALEWQADYFSACLLMPKMQIQKAYNTISHKISDLASLFEVSKEAMKISLERLNLIQKCN
jgi:hypothetical protein